jgi:membrane-anchored protein YejM (alkaline phosphatase superfamily)
MTGRSASMLSAAPALFGPIVWATYFLVIYASESLLCGLARGQAHTRLLVVATVLALLALLAHGVWQWRRLRAQDSQRFVMRAGLALNGLALLAIVQVAVAGLFLPACR